VFTDIQKISTVASEEKNKEKITDLQKILTVIWEEKKQGKNNVLKTLDESGRCTKDLRKKRTKIENI